MLERVMQMDKDDQIYYNSAEYKRLSSAIKVDERVDRIMNKLDVIHEDKCRKEGKVFDPFCDKDNPFYDKCLDLMNARCEEIEDYINKGWSDLEILEQFPDKIPTSQEEYDELSQAQIDALYRSRENESGGSVQSSESYTPEYEDLISDLWKRIFCCMAGWAVACIGFAVTSPLLSILFVMLGAVIVELPCYKILLAGGGISALFAATVGADTIWVDKDGKEVARDNNMASGALTGIVLWAITLIVGVFAVIFQIAKRFIQLSKMKKEQDLNLEFKHKPWAPIVIGIAFFIFGIICVGIINNIVEVQTSKIDDFTDEETAVMIEQIAEQMSKLDFAFEDEYDSNNYADPDHGTIYLKVEHDGETDSYLVTLNGKAKKDFKLNESQYIRVDGSWYAYDSENKALGAAASDSEVKELDKFTIRSMMGYSAMLENIGDVTIRDEYENTLTFHNKKGATKEKLEIKFSDPSVPENAIRILTSPYSFEAKGFNAYINFMYQKIDFNAYLPVN